MMDLYIALQLTLVIISLTGLWVYYYAFKTGYNNHKQGIKSSVPKKLYYASTYPALIWYVLPFVKQPRIHGIYDWIDGDFNIPSSVYIIITLSVFVYFFIFWGNKSVSKNFTATKESFYAPKKLLTDGIYGRVRHPMIIGDILCHFSLILFTGSIYTLCVFPIYILIDLYMIKVQVKFSLMPYFRKELLAYRKTTSSLLDRRLTLVLCLLLLLLFANISWFFI